MTRTPTLGEIRRWDTAPMIEAATRWSSTAQSWECTFSELTQHIAGTGWEGSAAEAARGLIASDRRQAIGHADGLRAAAFAARSGADRIAGTRNAVLAAVDAAEETGFSVGDDFTVNSRDPRLRARSDAVADDLRSRVGALLAVDRQVASEIGLLTKTFDFRSDHRIKQTPPGQPGPDRPVAPPEDPQRFNEFWNSLTTDQKDALFRRDESIGNHAGMPFADRDNYNRLRLDRLRGDSQNQTDALQSRFDELAAQVYMGDHSGETAAEMHSVAKRLADSRHRLDGYETVREALAAGDGVPRMLSLIDDEGHAAISVGDPDTAIRTATYVPGTGQDTTTFDEGIRRARDMFQATLAADPSLTKTDVAVTTWMGYDRPMTLAEAAWPDRARHGGAALDGFLDGMHASHFGPPAVDTVIGHSYGSTLIGAAATAGHRLASDNVIAVGSPGMLSRHAAELALESGATVYSMTAENDPISLVTSLTLGADPNDPDYGATRLVTNPGSALPFSAGLLPGVSAHGSYWDEGNPGLANMGAIIAGLDPISVLR